MSVFHYTSGVLDKIVDRFGNTLDFTHTSGLVTSVTDGRGQSFSVTYYSSTNRLKTVTTPDGAVWTFIYNLYGQLHEIQAPDTTQFPTGIDREFRYMNGASTSALNGNMSVEFSGSGCQILKMLYDSSDRVVEQTIGEGVVQFDYTDAASYKTKVTGQMGEIRYHTWDSTKLTRTKLEQMSNLDTRTSDPTSWVTEWTHDADGYLLTVELPRGNGMKQTLNAAKLPTERRFKQDMDAADSSTIDVIHTYAYDDEKFWGRLTYTSPGGEETAYTLNSYGQPTLITYPEITATHETVEESNTYNADGSLSTHTDGEDVVTKYEYFTTGLNKGRVENVIVDYGTGSELNLTTSYDYAPCGMVKEVTDPEGNTTTKTVECYGIVTKIAAPTALGYETTFTYDHDLNVLEKKSKNIDETGTWLSSPQYWKTTYQYNTYLQRTHMREYTDATNYRETLYSYDQAGRVNETLLDDRQTNLYHDERGLLFKRDRVLDTGTSTTNVSELYDYDLNGNLSTYTDPRSKDTEFEFDLFDRRNKTINALGHYEETTYDKDGRVTERKFYEEAGTTDVLMAHHKNTYDEMGRLTMSEDALIGTSTTWVDTEYAYDARSLVVSILDRRDNETTIAWDHARRRSSVTDALTNAIAYEYDDNGNMTAMEETEIVPGSSSQTFRTEFTYDAINRRTQQDVIDRTNSANKKTTQWKWNSRDVVAKLVDPMNVTTTNTYDGLGRKTQESVDMGSSAAIVTQWAFDDNNNMVLLTDDNGSETAYAFDTLNRLTEKTYEDATTYTQAFDAAGNVINIVDRAGNDIDLAYDDVNQLTDRDATLATGFGGDTTEEFAYDALGRLTEAKDDDSIVQLTFDSLGRVLTEKQGPNPFGTAAKTGTYSYDAAGNSTEIDYPSGFEAHRTFDALNRLTLVEDGSSVDIADWDLYGPARRRDVVTFGNGTTATYTYDGFRRPTDISHETSTPTEFAGFAYDWDKNDNPLYEARSHRSGKGDVYSYDNANRLVTVLQDVDDPLAEVASPGSEAYVDKVEFNMDDVLNFTSLVTTPYGSGSSTVSFTTNSMNEYTAVGGTTHVYDDNGNLIDDGVNEYVYDWKSHLIEVIDGTSQATIATYFYDCYGLGRRFKKVVGSDTTRFVYADQQCIEEYDGSNDLLRLFAFGTGLDEVVMMQAPDRADVDSNQNTSEIKRFFYHTQLIGSVTQVTDEDEVVVEEYDYGPYGEIAMFDISSSSISASAIGNPFTYTGRRLDEESGLYYYRARHYSSELKRFIQRDPLEYVDGPNAYGYASQSPTAGVDPTGLDDRDPYHGSPPPGGGPDIGPRDQDGHLLPGWEPSGDGGPGDPPPPPGETEPTPGSEGTGTSGEATDSGGMTQEQRAAYSLSQALSAHGVNIDYRRLPSMLRRYTNHEHMGWRARKLMREIHQLAAPNVRITVKEPDGTEHPDDAPNADYDPTVKQFADAVIGGDSAKSWGKP